MMRKLLLSLFFLSSAAFAYSRFNEGNEEENKIEELLERIHRTLEGIHQEAQKNRTINEEMLQLLKPEVWEQFSSN